MIRLDSRHLLKFKHVIVKPKHYQKDLRDICGFVACVCFIPPIPPSACLTDVSNMSLVAFGSVPVASLNAAGADVANDSKCVIPCVCSGDGGEQFGSRTSVAVGSSTHNNRTPGKRVLGRQVVRPSSDNSRKSSCTEAKNSENAFQTSFNAASRVSGNVPPSIIPALCATNSISPGISNLGHCRRSRFPDAAAVINVFAQWAAVNETCRENTDVRVCEMVCQGYATSSVVNF